MGLKPSHSEPRSGELSITDSKTDGIIKSPITIPPGECVPVWSLDNPAKSFSKMHTKNQTPFLKKKRPLSRQVVHVCIALLAGFLMGIFWLFISKSDLFHIPGMVAGNFTSILNKSDQISIQESFGVYPSPLKLKDLKVKVKKPANNMAPIAVKIKPKINPARDFSKMTESKIYGNKAGAPIIQLGAFGKKDNAEKFVILIQEKGFNAYLDLPVLKNGELLYRVRLKGYKSLADARKVKAQLVKHGLDSYIIHPRHNGGSKL